MDVREEPLALFFAAESGVGESEHLHRVLLDRRELDLAAPTPDELSVTKGGRRLDSAEAVISFLKELREQRPGSAS